MKEDRLHRQSIRVLVVDDFEPWRRFTCFTLQKQTELQIIDQASTGLEAVDKARELQPDLILLDIGLPKLNGLQAARQIRACAPNSKILFLSENRSWGVAREGLRIGASGYVVKSEAGSELLPAIKAVIQGKQFVSHNLSGRTSAEDSDDDPAATPSNMLSFSHPGDTEKEYQHEVAFYVDEGSLVAGFALFIAEALRTGCVVIFSSTETHRARVEQNLREVGLDPDLASEQGHYFPIDAPALLSTFIVNGDPDRVRVAEVMGSLIETSKAEDRSRIVVCGEFAPLLLANGNVDAAIRLERLWDEVARDYGVNSLCGYLTKAFERDPGGQIFRRVCAEHSAVHPPPPETIPSPKLQHHSPVS
jgi:DNA-binding NarL/FixJ family response regulator